MKLYRTAFKAMGSPCEVQLYARRVDQAQAAAALALADIQRLEARYSRYRKDSYLAEINRCAAAGGAMEVDPETASLLDYAQTCYRQSGGLFDITSGILRQAWRFELGKLPDLQQIAGLLDKIGWEKVVWEAPTLRFPMPGMEIDLGGVVKEYAADRAAVLCLQAGIGHGLVNLGGDIKIIGPHPDGGPWRVGIRHPRRNAVLETVALTSGAMASSGDYERCIVVGNTRYGHVLNPKTGWPVAKLAAVSVIADFCVVAGSASTIAMLKERQGPKWLRSLGLKHVWVDVKGGVGGSLRV